MGEGRRWWCASRVRDDLSEPATPRYLRLVAGKSLLNDCDLRAIDCCGHGRYQHDSENNLLGENAEAYEGHADPDHRNDQCADKGSPNASDAPRQRCPAHDD